VIFGDYTWEYKQHFFSSYPAKVNPGDSTTNSAHSSGHVTLAPASSLGRDNNTGYRAYGSREYSNNSRGGYRGGRGGGGEDREDGRRIHREGFGGRGGHREPSESGGNTRGGGGYRPHNRFHNNISSRGDHNNKHEPVPEWLNEPVMSPTDNHLGK
jgi:hypothetical protein